MKSLKFVVKHARFSPIDVALIIPATALLYVFMEWLFILSKPSFLTGTPFTGRLAIMFNSSAWISLAGLALMLPVSLLYYLIKQKTIRKVLRFVLCLVPALITAGMLLLLVDNITYSLFKFGVVSTKAIWRALYLSGFILLVFVLVIAFFRIARSIEKSRRKLTPRQKAVLPTSLLLVLLVCALLPVLHNPKYEVHNLQASDETISKNYPNIILITGDGINASVLSLYGAANDTTPFLKDLAVSSLVAQNNFSNAQGTIGSTTSMLTGKYPAQVRILASTDIMKGEDAFHHLPGLLQTNGYYTAQLSFSFYADAYQVNFQDAFDEANGESPIGSKIQEMIADALPTDYYYFMRAMFTRISARTGHLLYIKKMTNPFLQVTESPEKFNDQEKLDYLFKLLDESEQPVFVHIHWMGTHGPKYYPEKQVFSEGQNPKDQEKYDNNFYLDSILEFDGAIAKIQAGLEERGMSDQTVLVVTSDHTQRWSVARIPLLMRFPEGEHAGEIMENTQNLDIAPTLLDYLNIAQPDWMPGQSLLQPLDLGRPIFLAAIPDSKKDPETGKVIYPEAKAPFYQFGKMTVIVCDQYYLVNFMKQSLVNARVAGHRGACPQPDPDKSEALQLIINHLEEYGFDASSLSDVDTQ